MNRSLYYGLKTWQEGGDIKSPFFLWGLRFIVSAIGLVLVYLPFITKGYIFKSITINADIVIHSNIISQFAQGSVSLSQMGQMGYPAQVYWGFILGQVVKITGLSPETVFLVFMGIVLFCAFLCIYLMVSRIAGGRAGWLAMIIGILCTNAILILYRYGIIYNILEMSVLLPLLILFTVKWLDTNKKKYLAGLLIVLAVFSFSHYGTFYIIPCSILLLIGLLIYKWITHNDIGRYVKTVLMVMGVNFVILAVLVGIYVSAGNMASLPIGASLGIGYHPIDVGKFYNILSPSTTILAVLAVIGIFLTKKIEVSTPVKTLLFILSGLTLTSLIVCVGMTFSNVSSLIIDRLLIDLAMLVAIFVAVVLGCLFKVPDKRITNIKWLSYFVMLITAIITITVWVR